MRHKLFLLMVSLMTIAFGAKAADQGKVIFTIPPDTEIALAVDANQHTHYCTYTNEGMTYNFKVYDTGFNLEKEFTITPEKAEGKDLRVGYGYPDLNMSNGGTIVLTQNLYNSDDRWEVVFFDGDSNQSTVLKYTVYSEDGSKLFDFKGTDFSSDIYVDSGGELRYILDKKQSYIQFRTKDGETHFVVSFYDTTTSAQSISKPTVRAFPNPLPAGRTLTISLDSPVAYDAKLIVSDMNGRVVYRRNVKPGTDNITVPAGNLRHGMYIYNITAGSDLLQSGKVVAE